MVVPLFLLPALGRLDRGAVAVAAPEGNFVSWRLLPTDAPGAAFDVLRDGQKVNDRPLTGATSLLDRAPGPHRYAVRTAGGTEEALVSPKPYLSIPLKPLPGYTANDGSVGDLDGDGRLDLVVHRTGRTHDNSQKGETDPPILEAYTLDGRPLWRIDLGKNCRDGAHYNPFLVADFDGDGRAEVACRTADGTVDGTGKILGDPKANHRNPDGYVLKGPERLTVFDGRTGAALDTVPYDPPRHPQTPDPTPDQMKAEWGDGYGNRIDRFGACVAYLDGQRPSLVFQRGYYTRTVLAAWDFEGGKLRHRWTFDSTRAPEYSGNGNHNLAVADVDGDGRDEIVLGSCVVDDTGKGLYSTGLGHGDALHVGDLDPDRPGEEVFAIHEHSKTQTGVTFRDARTGEVLWKKASPDVGRGVCFDVDPRSPGSESWASMGPGLEVGMWSAKGERITEAHPKGCNFAVWWDGDGLRELLDGTTITKWNWRDGTETTLLDASDCASNNGTKATPVLCADILGDWREEVVLRSADDSELRVYTTTLPTAYRLTTLLADRQYRESVAWQNVGYNQPTHPSFDLARRLTAGKPVLWTIGDSTVRNGNATGGGGQWGWGEPLADLFDRNRIEVRNRAIGGRSSRTFLTDGRWDALLAEAKPEDFVLMQFGHNDPGAINDDSRARGTIRGIGEESETIDNLLTKRHETVHTFGWYLRQYVREAKSAGLRPVVLSYVPRSPKPGEPIAADPEPTSYRLWARQVAEAESVPFVDLYGLIWKEYARSTPEAIRERYFTSADATHTNRAGAELNAAKVAEGLRGGELGRYLRNP